MINETYSKSHTFTIKLKTVTQSDCVGSPWVLQIFDTVDHCRPQSVHET